MTEERALALYHEVWFGAPGDRASQRRELESVVEAACAEGAVRGIMAACLALFMLAHRRREPGEAAAWLERGLAHADFHVDRVLWLKLLNHRAVLHLREGAYVEGLRPLLTVERRAAELEGLELELAFTLGNLGESFLHLGDLPSARRYFERSALLAAHFDTDESAYLQLQVQALLSMLALFGGQIQEAEERHALARSILTRPQASAWRRWAEVVRLPAAFLALDRGDAAWALAEAIDLANSPSADQDASWSSMVAALAARAAFAKGDLALALQKAEQGITLARACRSTWLTSHLQRLAGEVAATRGDVETLSRLLTEATSPEARGGSTDLARMLRGVIERQVDDLHAARDVDLVAASRSLQETLEQLAQARDEARQVAEARRQFLGQMSHELRTPLQGVIGAADLLADAQLAPEHRGHLDTIARCADLTVGVVNDILDLGKLEAGRLDLREEPTSMTQVVDAVARTIASRAGSIPVSASVDHDVPAWIRLDARRIQQVLLNLVGNAAKFGRRGPVEVHVGVSRPGHVRVDVRDDGPGITPEDQRRLFHAYAQAEAGKDLPGTGLGLAIAKALVVRMGGNIGVISVPGVGSVFWFEIPAPATAPPIVEDVPGTTPDLQGWKVLLAEDNLVNARVAAGQLARLGAHVTLAHDGDSAIELGTSTRWDAVLMDLHLPRRSGCDAARALRDAGHAGLILAFTASLLEQDAQACADAGMDGVLYKPITTAQLGRALRASRHGPAGARPR